MSARQRPSKQGFFSRDAHGTSRKNGKKRNHKPCKEPGLSSVEFLELQSARPGANPFNYQLTSVNANACAKGAGHGNGALVIPTGRISAKVGRSAGKRRGNNSPLREALGGGHRKLLSLNKAEVPVKGIHKA